MLARRAVVLPLAMMCSVGCLPPLDRPLSSRDGSPRSEVAAADGPMQPDRAPPDQSREGASADAGPRDAAPGDRSSTCPDPAQVSGSYAGEFVDGAGGGLAKGQLGFTLQAAGPQALSLAGTFDGLALPGLMNYAIKGTLAGGIDCAALTAKLTGKLGGIAFDGQLSGTLGGGSAKGLWNGAQKGGPIAASGTWSATRK
jgi:hypothetical protein